MASGAWVAALIVASHKMIFAIVVGAFFLVGGILMVVKVGGPMWFTLLDLIVAYILMAWLGRKLATKN